MFSATQMNFVFAPASFSAVTAESPLMVSDSLPMWRTPESEADVFTTYSSGFFIRSSV